MSMDQEIEVMEGHATQMQREFVVEESSPRCVLEAPSLEEAGADLDHCAATISADSETLSDKQSTIDTADVTDTSIQWKSMFGNIKKKSVRRFSVIPLMSTYETITRINVVKKKLTKTNNNHGDVGAIDNFDVFPFDKPSWKNFRYKELAAATDDFNSGNMIGKGGYAEVYKGHLPDGRVVAVKKIMKTEKKEENMMTADFLSELGIIAHINHPNAAKLLGFSIDSGLHLVLEYLPFGSLGDKLHGSGECLDWEKRYKAATGIAEGLKYLHHDCPRRVIHRDIKASNILLAEDYEAQISDFGLAKWLPESCAQHIVFPIEGTFGYLAPEYFMDGIVDEKTDVFAYGVLLLEIVTGRHAVEHSTNQSLAMWAKPLLEQSDESALIDPRLGNDFNLAEMKRAMVTAFLCIDHDSDMRPSMARVVQILNGEDLALDAVMVHKTSSGRGVMLDASDLQDYTCTNYLNDLNRHMQLVME
ncbi:Receptor-like cytosolic serine/threonine-protein kinase RBK1 [Linum perenne]